MAAPYEHAKGSIAQGAGHMYVHRFRKVEDRSSTEAFYPLSERCQNLATELGYTDRFST